MIAINFEDYAEMIEYDFSSISMDEAVLYVLKDYREYTKKPMELLTFNDRNYKILANCLGSCKRWVSKHDVHAGFYLYLVGYKVLCSLKDEPLCEVIVNPNNTEFIDLTQT